MNEQASAFFSTATKWKEEYRLLREIISENPVLEEDFKWMHPCYTFRKKNVVLIHGFKDYCALLFHKGALLKDPDHVLIRQTENVQSARQIRFTDIGQIIALKPVIEAYIREAIANEKAGKTVALKKVDDYPMPEEFQRALDDDPALEAAFRALTPGRQRAYLFYFGQAKQAKTREGRVEKYYQRILAGKGMDD